MTHAQNVRVVFSCPDCGAEDYEEEFDGVDIANGSQVSLPCDECPNTIYLDVDVRIQSSAPSPT